MKLFIISPGKNHDRTIAESIYEYQKRLSAHHSVEWIFPSVGTKEEEAVAILKNLKNDDVVVLLDETGKMYSSPEFAKYIDAQLQEGIKRLVFVIGGAFGVSNKVKERANMTVSLSKMVFPHMLARLILIEQLYRATTILQGGKYHHE